jgi:hypothetical protein
VFISGRNSQPLTTKQKLESVDYSIDGSSLSLLLKLYFSNDKGVYSNESMECK